jgi:3-methyladenine DNA glycosylase AlkD
LQQLKTDLSKIANSEKAKILLRFFKTQKGEYGHGDKFLGITVPIQRQIAKKYYDLNLQDIGNLLHSSFHEYRLVALIILVKKFADARSKEQTLIYKFYLKNYRFINNWDLVDLSSPNIVGSYLLNRPKDQLYKLVQSNNLWKKRIAIVATFSFIKAHNFEPTLKLATRLMTDKHDLIHKALGWMLREIGKRNLKPLKQFLDEYADKMPRTMLRYAIEKFNKKDYYHYLYARSSR